MKTFVTYIYLTKGSLAKLVASQLRLSFLAFKRKRDVLFSRGIFALTQCWRKLRNPNPSGQL